MKFGFSETIGLAAVISSPRELPFLATNRVHEGDQVGGKRVMRTRTVGPVRKSAEIERLYIELASFNERIQELERQHPNASKIEALKASALGLARQIDELRCSNTNHLTDLLTK